MTTDNINIKDFVCLHEKQLQTLNIPSPLYGELASRLNDALGNDDNDSSSLIDLEKALAASQSSFSSLSDGVSDYGSMLVIPHLCSWDMAAEPSRGMWDALEELPVSVLRKVLLGLHALSDNPSSLDDEETDKQSLLNEICTPRAWSRVILYRQEETNRVRAALPAPPYPPQVAVANESDNTEADLTGPFPFRYYIDSGSPRGVEAIDCSLAYLSPGVTFREGQLPTLDLCPSYSVPNALTRSVRYAALLEDNAPEYCLERVKEIHANFVHGMHLVRQQKLKGLEDQGPLNEESTGNQSDMVVDPDKVWKIYTDSDDPMQLSHPSSGLTSQKFVLTTSLEDADIIYSYRSLFAPGELRQALESHSNVLINQFPYEGAFVQKDHLGREILRQHGLPRPSWALETYDLDVQLAEFVGAALLASERSEDKPLWIIKPARGTQSKGHVVTRSLAHVLRLVDCGGESRVAQRYIENPICYGGKKVDCRCIVMMTSANPPGRPSLFMHKRVYFRIAGKKHAVSAPSDLIDSEAVLTAMHLVNDVKPTTPDQNSEAGKLPLDFKTIAHLKRDYKNVGFDWEDKILPKIYTMIRELFNGMTEAYPDMAKSKKSRALYGVDVMFELEEGGVEPKLTEVTFCPSNNAVCDAYERDEQLYHQYNNDIFSCLFLGKLPDTITRLQ